MFPNGATSTIQRSFGVVTFKLQSPQEDKVPLWPKGSGANSNGS
jgi:hypothetical protein